jgi:hypothetical protein
MGVPPTNAIVNLTRPLGLEFEMLAPVTEAKSRFEFQIALARILTANGIPAIARGYSSAPVPFGVAACVEFDDSLSPPETYHGINWANLEIKTKKLAGLPEFDRFVPRLLELCRFLNCGAHVSTGLHVHLGVMREAQEPHFLRSLLNLLWRFEPVLFGLVHWSRRTSGFCAPMPDLRRLWAGAESASTRRELLNLWHRRYGVNIRHLLAPPQPSGHRIEFRMHEGTLDAEETRHWVVLLNRLIDHAVTHACKTPASQAQRTRRGLEQMFITIGLKPNNRLYPVVSPELAATRRFLLERWRRLRGMNE